MAITLVRMATHKHIFRPTAKWALEQTNKSTRGWTDTERDEKEEKWAMSCFKLCYMVIATTGGYCVVSGEPFFPPSLGGSNEQWLESLFAPTAEATIAPQAKLFYMIELG